jgi:Zinc carboxypeptidase
VSLPKAALAVAIWLAGAGVLAQPAASRPPRAARSNGNDEEYARLVRQWTTRPEFMSPLVDHLPRSTTVPSPYDVLGHHIGEPKRLTYIRDQQRYLRALERASPRVKTMTIGRTEEGREILVAFVSSDENIRDLEPNRQRLRRLADPRGLTPDEARHLIARTKPHYHITAGLHSTEVSPPEMVMELAYRLAVSD